MDNKILEALHTLSKFGIKFKDYEGTARIFEAMNSDNKAFYLEMLRRQVEYGRVWPVPRND